MSPGAGKQSTRAAPAALIALIAPIARIAQFALAVLMGLFATATDPGCAAAAVLDVRADGRGTHATIQAALDAAKAGDTVQLGPGVYAGPGNVDLNFRGKPVILRGDPTDPGSRIIDCAGPSADTHHRAFLFTTGESERTAVRGLTVTGGLAPGDAAPDGLGGAVLCVDAAPEMSDCILRGNWAHTGGALALHNSAPLLVRCRFQQNTAEIGGAISIAGGRPRLQGCTFFGNTAARGGAVVCFQGRTEIAGCVLGANSATLGGAIALAEGAILQLQDSILDNNFASAGGALHLQDGNLGLERCSVVMNAAGTGGGLFCEGRSQVMLAGTLIAYGTRGQAVVAEPSVQLQFSCCLLWGNGGGDWTGTLAGLPGQGGNLAADPLLAAPATGDYTPSPRSPCRGGPCGGIGAIGVTGVVE